jgi:2,3-bisphosphoglycerate-independent phosphoglycerate mutase
MMRESFSLLSHHPVNKKRVQNGKRPANSMWFWGEGRRPALPSFKELYGLCGSVISAVDLLKGIGKAAAMITPDVPGATGYIDTNFKGKAMAALENLKDGCDYVYIHIEAPDECGHRNEPHNKVLSLELIDDQVLKPLLNGLREYEDYKIMALPDHPTPIVTGTHCSDPVPFMIYNSKDTRMREPQSFNEETASKSGLYFDNCIELVKYFLDK